MILRSKQAEFRSHNQCTFGAKKFNYFGSFANDTYLADLRLQEGLSPRLLTPTMTERQFSRSSTVLTRR